MAGCECVCAFPGFHIILQGSKPFPQPMSSRGRCRGTVSHRPSVGWRMDILPILSIRHPNLRDQGCRAKQCKGKIETCFLFGVLLVIPLLANHEQPTDGSTNHVARDILDPSLLLLRSRNIIGGFRWVPLPFPFPSRPHPPLGSLRPEP